ncbi:MAG TPA: Uma2 family endonuclease [Dehalococcoidia bacterium]|nr:Uma2 family endonuclease [Dehalococcoidia bacterium]
MVAKRKPEAMPEWQPQRRLFTVDEYERMIEAGVIREGERVELIEGEIVCMAAIGLRHWRAVNVLNDFFTPRLSGRAIVSIQMSVRLAPGSEPEPDLAIVRRRDDFYAEGLPESKDVLLIIEVADSSLPHDLRRKLPTYAAAGIPETWIFNLRGEQALIHRKPRGRRYSEITTVERGGTLTPLAFPVLTIALDDVLGPPPETYATR